MARQTIADVIEIVTAAAYEDFVKFVDEYVSMDSIRGTGEDEVAAMIDLRLGLDGAGRRDRERSAEWRSRAGRDSR